MARGEGGRSSRPGWVRNVVYVFIILVSVVLIYLFTVREMRFFKVPTSSMEPTFYPNDYLMSLSHPEYHRGDIVIVHDPVGDGGYLVKRIVAVGGDMVAAEGGGLLLNDAYASEPYVKSPMTYRMSPQTAPAETVFILGDNRNNSDDSHSWDPRDPRNPISPFISTDDIVGRVHAIYLPWKRMRWVRSFPLENAKGG